MVKVFLSYSRADSQELARELHRRLVRDGIECFYDEASIEWGANFVLALEDGLEECDHFISVLSPGYVNSEWTTVERTSITLDDPAGRNRKILPLLYKACDIPRLLKSVQTLDVTSNDLFDKQYPKICAALGGVMQSVAVEIDVYSSVLPAVTRLPSRHRMPFRSLGTRFKGRVNALHDLHQMLKDGVAVVDGVGVVVGTGGLGKTQLAIEYVHRFGTHYQGGVFWINADQPYISAIASLADAAGIELDAKLTEQEQVEMVWQGMANSANTTLIVYDNFQEDEIFQRWLPVNAIHIKTLVTTRRKDLAASKVTLNFMDENESLAMLNSRERQHTASQASPLVALLGGLPLALELTSNYLNLRRDISIPQLVEEMHRIGDLIALDSFSTKYRDELPTGHEKSVTATFQISWNQTSEDEKRILQFVAACAPTSLPRRLLHAAFDEGPVSVLEDPIEEAIENLARLSLVDLDDDNDPFIHRLLRDFIRTVAPNAAIQSNATSIVKQELSRIADAKDFCASDELAKVTPHAQSLITDMPNKPAEIIEIYRYLCWYDIKLGRYES